MNMVEDYARRRKLDTNVKERMQQGEDPMDVGAVAEWVYALGLKGKLKGKGGR